MSDRSMTAHDNNDNNKNQTATPITPAKMQQRLLGLP